MCHASSVHSAHSAQGRFNLNPANIAGAAAQWAAVGGSPCLVDGTADTDPLLSSLSGHVYPTLV